MKLMVVGATGLVGSHVLELALANETVEQVIAPVRKPLSAHPKLLSPQVDFEQLPEDAAWWQVDAVICALGTTMRTAGSRSAFYRVDHDYPLAVARLAHRYGAPTYVLNSAMGANHDSRIFYNRVKGELEHDLAKIGFESLAFVRPGLIGGTRNEFRIGERALAMVLQTFGAVLPKAWRINPAEQIAKAMLEAAKRADPGLSVVTSRELL